MKHFLSRLLSTVVLLSIFAYCVAGKGGMPEKLFTILAAAASFMAVFEFCDIMKKSGVAVYPLTAGFLSAVVPVVFYFDNGGNWFVKILIIPFSIVLWLLILFLRKKENNIQAVLNVLGSTVLFAIPISCIMYIFMTGTDGTNIKFHFLYFILVTKAGDIGAYIAGTLTNKMMKNGNHKMAPTISPGKSWEGVAGGLFLSVAVSVALSMSDYALFNIFYSVVLGVVLFIGGALGDLAESAFKRTYRVKDSGVRLPGIGGVLDLVDSLMINAPLFVIILTVQTLTIAS